MKENEVIISCIMPVYNTANMLRKTLSSLVNQIFEKIEIICVNDASNDNSLEILKEFAQKDQRIKILDRKERSGAAVSRNIGLEMTRGEYVIFLDSDDYFYPEMLQVAYTNIIEKQADVLIFGTSNKVLDEDGNIVAEKNVSYPEDLVIEREEIINNIYRDRFVPWNKLVKRQLLLDNDIKFQDVPNCNDLYYSMTTFFSANRIAYCSKVLLDYYVDRSGSLSMKRKSRNYVVQAFEKVYLFLREQQYSEEFIERYIKYVIKHMTQFIGSAEHSENAKFLAIQDLKNGELLCKFRALGEKNVMYKKMVDDVLSLKSRSENEYYEEYVVEVLTFVHNENKKVALWGCGKRGKELLSLLDKYKLKIDFVIDMSAELQGKYCNGYIIQAYDKVCDEVDVILVTNSIFVEDIRKVARNKTVIDLHVYENVAQMI